VNRATKPPSESDAPRRGLPILVLRHRDQAVAAFVACVCLALLIAQWFFFGGHRGQIVEFQEIKPRTADFKIDINQANWPEFMMLPGIGETTAKRIVEYRETHGPFTSHANLLDIEGIGERTLGRVGQFLLPVAKETSGS
jgi:competence ComEA-like helix-hairpin-helix protein